MLEGLKWGGKSLAKLFYCEQIKTTYLWCNKNGAGQDKAAINNRKSRKLIKTYKIVHSYLLL